MCMVLFMHVVGTINGNRTLYLYYRGKLLGQALLNIFQVLNPWKVSKNLKEDKLTDQFKRIFYQEIITVKTRLRHSNKKEILTLKIICQVSSVNEHIYLIILIQSIIVCFDIFYWFIHCVTFLSNRDEIESYTL